MLVAVLVVAAIAVAAVVAAFVTRAKLEAERERAAAAAKRHDDELAAAQRDLASTREQLDAERAAHLAATEHGDQLRAELADANEHSAAAEQRARAAAAAGGIEADVAWPLELLRSERTWRFSVSPGPQADSPLGSPESEFVAALKIDVDAARNDIGADVELAVDLPTALEPATQMLALRIAQELLADVVRRSDTSTVRLRADGADLVISVEATGDDGEPVLPEPLPIASPRVEPIDQGVRLLDCVPVEDDEAQPTPPAE